MSVKWHTFIWRVNFLATSATLKQPTKGCRLAEIKNQKQMLERCVSLELKTQAPDHKPRTASAQTQPHNPVSALSSIADSSSSTVTKPQGWERDTKETSNDLGGPVRSEKPGSERNSSSLNSQLFVPFFFKYTDGSSWITKKVRLKLCETKRKINREDFVSVSYVLGRAPLISLCIWVFDDEYQSWQMVQTVQFFSLQFLAFIWSPCLFQCVIFIYFFLWGLINFCSYYC